MAFICFLDKPFHKVPTPSFCVFFEYCTGFCSFHLKKDFNKAFSGYLIVWAIGGSMQWAANFHIKFLYYVQFSPTILTIWQFYFTARFTHSLEPKQCQFKSVAIFLNRLQWNVWRHVCFLPRKICSLVCVGLVWRLFFLLQLSVRYPCYLRLFWWGLETLASNDQYWTLLGFLRETFAVPGVCWNVSCTILSLPLISRKRQCCVCTSPCPESTYLFYYDPFYGAG